MQTVITDTYSFGELSEEAKAHALDIMYDINTNYDWWYAVYEDVKEIGKILGINITDIYFSGFSSQGDGACFEGAYEYKKGSVKGIIAYAPEDKELHDIARRLFDVQRKHLYLLRATVRHHGHYYHELCTDIDVTNMETGDWAGKETEDEISDVLRSFMQWIYRTLGREFEYLTSEEQVIETIEANEYQFTVDGKRAHTLD